MIGGLATIYVACWVFQAGARSDAPNPMKWVVIAIIIFFSIQVTWNLVDAYYIFSDNRPIVEPIVTGFIIVAFIRTKLVMREKLTFANLFSHMNIFTGRVKKDD